MSTPPYVVGLEWCEGLGYVPGPTRVFHNLYQGALACEPSRVAARRGEFDLVVLCAHDVELPTMPSRVERLHLRLQDKPKLNLSERLQVQAAVRRILAVLHKDRKVLVACAMGLNRSSLVVGKTLRHLGATPSQAVALIQRARGPFALRVGGGPYFQELIAEEV